jgi:hypothetical protein
VVPPAEEDDDADEDDEDDDDNERSLVSVSVRGCTHGNNGIAVAT